jgi:hypothetical protein
MPLHDPRRQEFIERRAEFTTIGGEVNLSHEQRIEGLQKLLNEVREHVKNVTNN